MPSPFPGMDPYIESPALWSDFHNSLAYEMRVRLNQMIQPDYFARLTPYVTYEVVEIGRSQGIRPDVAIWQDQTLAQPASEEMAGQVETATVTNFEPSPVRSRVAMEIPLRLSQVEIYQTEMETLVTVIEILSPVNKRPGHTAHSDYLRKRRDLLRSTVHLVELDLLRQGQRPPLEEPVPDAPYYVVLSRAEERPLVDVWPIHLPEPLPAIPIPLLDPDPDAVVDLQRLLTTIYDQGAYTSQIDYSQPPPPPALSDEDTIWLKQVLAR